MKKDKTERMPVGVILITHTDYGAALLRAAESIVGAQQECRAISVDVSQPVEDTLAVIRQAVKETDVGSGALFLTDMFGGTPTNLSLSMLGAGQLEVITGVNLPMLIKVLVSRRLPLSQLAEEAKAAGVNGIVVAGEVLRRKVAEG